MFLPDEKVNISVLHCIIAQVASSMRAQVYEIKEISNSLITIEEKIEELVARLQNALSFSEAVAKKERAEVVVTFLAVLHLLKNRKIKITQSENFADIIIEKND